VRYSARRRQDRSAAASVGIAARALIQVIFRAVASLDPRPSGCTADVYARSGHERPQNGAKQRVALSTENPYVD
jgi:hypothetical protein